MAAELAIVNKKRTQSTRKRERIELLEIPPQPEWFVRSKNPHGREVWYVRFTVTGYRARLFGPFPSKRAGLLFLDGALDKLADFWTEVDDVRNRYAREGEFEHVSWGPILEHPLAAPRDKHREGIQ